MIIRTKILVSAALFLMALYISDSVEATDGESKSIAVMSFVNYSGDYRAFDVVMPEIVRVAEEKLGGVYGPSQFRDVLRKYRIRSLGMISGKDALKIKEELGIDYIILGSLDFFRQSLPLEVGISLRILDAENMRVLYSVSYSATNLDFMKIFGFGRIEDIEVLTEKVVEKAFKEISYEKLNRLKNSDVSKIKIAVIKFDNSSRVQHAGRIVSNQLVTQLYNYGFEVIEPGFIQELMLDNQENFIGEIDLITMNKIHQSFNADLVVTGIVDKFKFARGNNGESSSEAGMDMRFLNAAKGEILYINELLENGENSEAFFKLGRCHSLGKLTSKVINNIIKKFVKEKGYEKLLRS